MNLLKNIPLMAFVFGLGLIGITSAFKGVPAESKSVRIAEWYYVTQISAGSDFTPSNLKIVGTPTTQPTDGNCNVSNSGHPCAVRLDNPEEVTVDEDTQLSALPEGVEIDIYAKQIEENLH